MSTDNFNELLLFINRVFIDPWIYFKVILYTPKYIYIFNPMRKFRKHFAEFVIRVFDEIYYVYKVDNE